MTIVDITYMINRDERYGRRRMYNNHTGEMWWEPVKSMGPVASTPIEVVAGPTTDPAPPSAVEVNVLVADPVAPVIQQAMEEEEALLKSAKPTHKSKAKRLLHG